MVTVLPDLTNTTTTTTTDPAQILPGQVINLA